MKQKTLFKISDYTSEHGGSLQESKRKSRRPLSCNLPHHFVLSADIQDCGSLVRHAQTIRNSIREHAEKYKVVVHEIAVNSNHCHLAISFDNRLSYLSFIRTVTAALARTIQVKWKLLPYSKMVHWGKEFENLRWYIERNALEAQGLTNYKSGRRKA